MSFKEEKIRQFRDLPDRVDLEREGALLEEGKVKIELIKAKPEVHLHKWNSEINLGIYYDKIQKAGQKVGNRMEWKDQKEEVHAYPLEAQEGMEDGGLEMEVLLKEKPVTNKFDFVIDGAENLAFFYQPALTQAEIDEGATRPENVVGSYAVYHKTKSNHRTGSTNYATGKAFHIYRPKAIDANGVETWGELSYLNGNLTVTVPQQFLDDAVYPVMIDPTFGYTTIGGTSATSGQIGATKFTSPSDLGTITAINMYGSNTVEKNHGSAVYSDSSGSPNSKLAEDLGNSIINILAWNTETHNISLSANTVYWLAEAHDSGSGTSRTYYYDTGDTNQRAFRSISWETWPNPMGTVTFQARVQSIYATYTASGGTTTSSSTSSTTTSSTSTSTTSSTTSSSSTSTSTTSSSTSTSTTSSS